MKQLTSHVDIDATPDQVWAVLSDLAGWSDWNPFVVDAAGSAVEGERLTVRIQPPGKKGTTFKPTVTEAVPGAVLEWLGRLGVRGVFDGRHRFALEAMGGGTRFHQSEQFSGILSGLFFRMIGDETLEGFHLMNAALKERVESSNGGA